MRKTHFLVIGGMLCAAGILLQPPESRADVAAEARPDAGSLFRDQMSTVPSTMPDRFRQDSVDEKVNPGAVKEDPNALRIVVKGYVFSGYESLVTEQELQDLVSPTVGNALTYKELQTVADAVTALLHKQGWFLASAYLPKQDVTAGVIQIVINPALSDDRAHILPDKTVRIKKCLLDCIPKDAVRKGYPVDEDELSHALLLMNDLPGISARSSVAAGKTPGTAIVEIAVTEGPLFRGFLLGDNYGNRYTGIWRASALIGANDPFHIGDQASLMVTGADGLLQGRASYSFPILLEGLKGFMSGTLMKYKLVQELEPLDYNGFSVGYDAGLTNTLLRGRNANAAITFTYANRWLIDSKSVTDIRDRRLNSFTVSANGDMQDTYKGGGNTNWTLGLTAGNFHDRISDATLSRTDGFYTRYNYSLNRLQRLRERVTLSVMWKGQKSIKNLDSSEEFTIGGPYAVRAYPVGEGTGDEGDLINVDMRYTLPAPPTWGSFQAGVFYDAGHIRKNWGPSDIPLSTATNLNQYWLQGVGVGLGYIFPGKLSMNLAWAHTVGNNPGRSTSGTNADGLKTNNRFWFQALRYF